MPKKTDPLSSHPSIQLVRDITHRYPNPALYVSIIGALGDEPDGDVLRTCYIEWIKRGYSPVNMAWLFDWYKKRYIPNGPKLSRREQPRPKQEEPMKLNDIDMVRLLIQIKPSTMTFEEYLDRYVYEGGMRPSERDLYLKIAAELG